MENEDKKSEQKSEEFDEEEGVSSDDGRFESVVRTEVAELKEGTSFG